MTMIRTLPSQTIKLRHVPRSFDLLRQLLCPTSSKTPAMYSPRLLIIAVAALATSVAAAPALEERQWPWFNCTSPTYGDCTCSRFRLRVQVLMELTLYRPLLPAGVLPVRRCRQPWLLHRRERLPLHRLRAILARRNRALR